MRQLLSGNEACAIGAIRAGVRFFAGYPITPSTEIAEYLARELPKVGGTFIQMEDEIGSICCMNGATAAGLKAMTATSGPGFSLMQEGIGYSIMAELPCVIVNVMRGGPATGTPTRTSQADVMQARYGTHGDHPIVVLCPWSVRECFDLTVTAVNISERLRIPVIVLMDEIVGHMREVVELPEEVKVWQSEKPKPPRDDYYHYDDSNNYDARIASFGEGYRIHLTGLTHRKDGFPTDEPDIIKWNLDRLRKKIEDNRSWLYDIYYEDLGSETVIVCYGSSARSALAAKQEFERKTGRRVGIIRLRMIWPFPSQRLIALLRSARRVIVPEMNQGQLYREIERTVSLNVPVVSVQRYDGEMLTPGEIIEAL
ncbi:MAG: 2-oxoacid:acceptor oxidoreductase subunit alpha [candidate division WOR-3 bacterium]